MSWIAIDVGGTKTLGAIVTWPGSIVNATRLVTHRDGAQLIAQLCFLVERLRDSKTQGVAICLPGLVDAQGGVLVYAPRPELVDLPVAALMQERCGLPVTICNDANAATWAECVLGAARGHQDVVGVMVGTGVGCGVVLGGRLMRGACGFASEVGTLQLHRNATVSTVEEVASGSAITREALRLANAGLVKGTSGATLAKEALMGNRHACSVFDEVGDAIGTTVASLVNLLDPAIVVIGGGASRAGELLTVPARRAMQDKIYASRHRPAVQVVTACFPNTGGVLGAALLAQRKGL